MMRTFTRVTGLLLGLFGSAALALDQVLEVEIFNATQHDIAPGKDFSWLNPPENLGHDFVITPGNSQELMYYLPKSRGTEVFTYQHGEHACHFGFGHLTPDSANLNRWVGAKSVGSRPALCSAELIAVPDDDEFVSHGGSRVMFTMR